MAEQGGASKASAALLGPGSRPGTPISPDETPPDQTTLAQILGFPAPSGRLDLEVRRGDVLLLRGPNGSGKTSLLRALAGLEAPVRPRAALLGGDLPHRLPGPELARRVRAVWDDARAGLVGLTLDGEARLRRIPLPSSLAALRDRDVATLSDGEARRAAIAFAAANPAPLLLLDEPYTALDGEGAELVDGLVTEARSRGAVIVADHSGRASRFATGTVDLAPAVASQTPLVRPVAGPTLLRAPAATVPRGQRLLSLPGAALPAGAHAVTGPNGAGKSTLLRRLSGLQDADGVTVADGPVSPGHNTRLLLPAAGELFTAATVREELGDAKDAWGLVAAALLGRHPLSLSAGEAQRVALVKALGRPAPIHLLDEPEAHLDDDGLARLRQAIADRVAAGSCVVAATHDPAAYATRIEVGP